ncbi:hypothetical protein [Clostridium baratii]|uniref:hypothetical protein n=1 Tax=Clostridium baratii TaxID=1561 RepID=UPI0030D0A803
MDNNYVEKFVIEDIWGQEEEIRLTKIILGMMFDKYKKYIGKEIEHYDIKNKKEIIDLFTKVINGLRYRLNGCLKDEDDAIESLLNITEAIHVESNIEKLIDKYFETMDKRKIKIKIKKEFNDVVKKEKKYWPEKDVEFIYE